MASKPYDVFVALDGPVLNGMEGPVGILRCRIWPDEDRHEIKVKFYDGASGGHAVQINKEGTIGHVGGFSRQLIFFDTETLEEIKRMSTTNYGRIECNFESQTHVAFLSERVFVTSIRGHFYKFHLDNLNEAEDLGPHHVHLPHAVKLSPSGRYLFYGAMDTDYGGWARKFGVFDLQEPDKEKRARLLDLDDTAWHFQNHPTEDVCYAVSECYDPGPGIGDAPFDFYSSFSIAYRRNWVWKIDGKTAKEIGKISVPAFMPSHLTSDLVVMADENDTVYYNACASSTIAKVEFKTGKTEHFDERVGFWYTLFHPSLWGAAVENWMEAGRRISLWMNFQIFMRAMKVSRWSFIDGSYGLVLSPDGKTMVSCHRGLNEIILYDFPEMKRRKRIKLPAARKYFPRYLGLFSDQRLGMHHAVMSATSATRGR